MRTCSRRAAILRSCEMSTSKFARVKVTTPEIGDSPHQPIFFNFPKREFGKKVIVKRSFQSGVSTKYL